MHVRLDASAFRKIISAISLGVFFWLLHDICCCKRLYGGPLNLIVVVKGKMHFDGIEVAIYSPSIKNISRAYYMQHIPAAAIII